MMTTPDERWAVQRAAELEHPLSALETQLELLGQALQQRDLPALDRAAGDLQHVLALAVDHFGRAARNGGVPPPLRHRLAVAGGRVAAQREALARATAALDRAIDVLLPGQLPSGLYSAAGAADRPAGRGSLLA
ncbi:MAG: hypothetical protein KGN16_05515 [Burkholderiales bacterium]|nr:hypothetical protein [Burkholderiales bacterium]